MTTSRLHVRAGEVPILYGEDAKTSEWSLWNAMTKGEDGPIGEFGLWRSRLATEIMKGVCKDHKINTISSCETDGAAHDTGIMPPRAWRIAPCHRTDHMDAVLVVDMRSGQQMRDWKLPDAIPQRALRRLKAIGAAYGVPRVCIAILIDGSTSQVFTVSIEDHEAADMKRRVADMIASVRDAEEPEIDFAKDERQVRAGVAVTRVAHASGLVDGLLQERRAAVAEVARTDAVNKSASDRLRQVDTKLIHIAGTTGKIETDTAIVEIVRNAKNVPTVSVAYKTTGDPDQRPLDLSALAPNAGADPDPEPEDAEPIRASVIAADEPLF